MEDAAVVEVGEDAAACPPELPPGPAVITPEVVVPEFTVPEDGLFTVTVEDPVPGVLFPAPAL